MKYLPVASTFTAERAAYRTLLNKAHEWFPEGRDPGFDLLDCAENEFNDWIGAQIRADDMAGYAQATLILQHA
ncbi:MAG: hypothetical protein CM15mP120_27200 [Pseudomonadota bacterium]|nr:MAG: hypothetical protein CM15mP120_27200 [Pseudomonadota bacterium]